MTMMAMGRIGIWSSIRSPESRRGEATSMALKCGGGSAARDLNGGGAQDRGDGDWGAAGKRLRGTGVESRDVTGDHHGHLAVAVGGDLRNDRRRPTGQLAGADIRLVAAGLEAHRDPARQGP